MHKTWLPSLGVLAMASAAHAECPSGGVPGTDVREGATYKVVAVSPEDAFYSDRAEIIGQVGEVTERGSSDGCWVGGEVVFTDGSSKYFYRVELAPTGAGGAIGGLTLDPEPTPWGCPPGAVSQVRNGERLQILQIHNEDAYHSSRSQYERKWGRPDGMSISNTPCFFGGSFTLDDGTSMYFYKASFTRGGSTDTKPKMATGAGCPESSWTGTLWSGQRVKILDVHKDDAWLPEHDEIVGQSGMIETSLEGSGCWLEGAVRTDDGTYRFFHKVAVGEPAEKPIPTLRAASRKNTLPKGTAVQLVDIHYYDGHAHERERLVGKECTVAEEDLVETGSAWLGGHLKCGARTYSFFRVRVAEL
ncbi:MAG: hypothetical protein EP330_27265 [Deltaproteobacteria bacterium]|nr:MAG: hypothetical protein EP330_27265 [Deltaproteobacteria bacterium]